MVDRVILASASPRRLDLLRAIGLSPEIRPSGVEETDLPGERPEQLVRRLAEAKGRDTASRIGDGEPPSLVLSADTAVVVDDRALGKPADEREARSMLDSLRGRAHEVITGVFLMRTDDGRSTCDAETTRVWFRHFDERTVTDYVATGEPMDKAGAYGIQGRGGALVERVRGSWTNVVGLPLERLPEWAGRIGLDLSRLGAVPPTLRFR
jgi:septum formation protein